MNKLEEGRAVIDRVDREMARLFEERMRAVEGIAEYKEALGLPVLDASREQAVIEKNQAYIADLKLKPYYTDFLQELMRISRKFQEDQRTS